jgi:hypothetical protein
LHFHLHFVSVDGSADKCTPEQNKILGDEGREYNSLPTGEFAAVVDVGYRSIL